MEDRFDVQLHRPDGGAWLPGLLLGGGGVLVAGALVGAILGLVSTVFYLVVLFPLLAGGLMGVLGLVVIRWGKIRNTGICFTLAMIAGISCLFVTHSIEKRAAVREIGSVTHPQAGELAATVASMGVLEYLDWYAENISVSIGRVGRGKGGMSLGRIGSWIYWGFEFLLITLVAMGIMIEKSKRPFDREFEVWKEPGQDREFSSQPALLAQAFLLGSPKVIEKVISAGGPMRVRVRPWVGPGVTTESTIEYELLALKTDSQEKVSEHAFLTMSYPHRAADAVDAAIRAGSLTAAHGSIEASEEVWEDEELAGPTEL